MIKNPVHPGIIVREEVLAPLDLSRFAAADRLGISLDTLSHLVNGKADIDAAIAVALENMGAGTATTWLRIQAAYDQWKTVPDTTHTAR